jgi:TonB family protein
VHAEDPIAPQIPGVSGGTVVVKITIDEVGRIAEARATGLAMRGAGLNVSATEDIIGEIDRKVRALPAQNAAAARQAAPAFVDAALTSVRQWRYEPPAEGPLTFTVAVNIGATPEAMAFKPAGDAPRAGGAGAADNALRVGGAIKPPLKVVDVRPDYPPLAKAAGVTGVVILETRIGVDGGVEDARVLRSIPLLDEAALDAVKQWKFQPTLLNGQPVPIVMTTTINFTLADQ